MKGSKICNRRHQKFALFKAGDREMIAMGHPMIFSFYSAL